MVGLFLGLAGLYGAAGVALGAAAAHGLDTTLSADAISWVETASQYLLWHALALTGVAALWTRCPGRMLLGAGMLFSIGAFLFPGALLALAFLDWREAAAMAPFGGAALIAGWLALAASGVAGSFNRQSE